jgi:hypothetical protein
MSARVGPGRRRPPSGGAGTCVEFLGMSIMKRRSAAACGLAAPGILALAVLLATPAAAAGPATGGLRDTTPGETAYMVGPGVTQLLVTLVGGTGGSTSDNFAGSVYTTPGGSAGTVSGLLSVSPGETLYLEVGANGASGSGSAAIGGGGVGGFTSNPDYPTYSAVSGGGGGGGATDIQLCAAASCTPALFGTAADPRLVVAGGGGGAGDFNAGLSGFGGAGGEPATSGDPGLSEVGVTGRAGGAGTATTGGQGGLAGAGYGGSDNGSPGSAGTATTGGEGGGGSPAGGAGGGGGGGGYFAGGGGGGGGYGNGGPGGIGPGGGGGGGESYAGPALSQVTFGRVANSTPSITIQYPSTTTLSAQPASGPGGSQVTLSAVVGSVDGGSPTGSVSVTEGGSPFCTITLAQGHGSCSASLPGAGSIQFLASYSGDPTYAASQGQLAYTVSAKIPVPAAGAGFPLLPAVPLVVLGLALGAGGSASRRRLRVQ